MALKELADKGLRIFGGSALTQGDWGARLETVDWQVPDRVQSEGPNLRLSELEPRLALAVSLQFRPTEAGVPLPDDPFTGKPFAGSLAGAVAKLQGAAPKGEASDPHFALAFEVVVGTPERLNSQSPARENVKK